jgi:PIN domain nuclease of toxin-antitoxin system
MDYLLDTHSLLWIVTDDPRLSTKAKELFLDDDNEIYFSIASIWELAIKISLKRVILDEPLDIFIKSHIQGNNIKILPIEIKHVLKVENLPFHHRYPFDRLIISQGIVENIPIITKDSDFESYPIKKIW